jgi:hypothetical protein
MRFFRADAAYAIPAIYARQEEAGLPEDAANSRILNDYSLKRDKARGCLSQ